MDEWELEGTSEHLVADLQNQGAVVEQRTYPGTDHFFANADVSLFVTDASHGPGPRQ